MAVEMRRRIEAGVGAEIPVTLAMDHPGCPTSPTICWTTSWGSPNSPAAVRTRHHRRHHPHR